MKILADASLPGLEQAFATPFTLTLYHNKEELIALLPGQDVLVCRAHLKVNESLLKHAKLRYVATASSGTDHIDKAYLKARNIQLIDAKGSNASAVADYVLACLAYLDQAGLVQGRSAGVIGMGEVGSRVVERLQQLNFQVRCYDPPKGLREPGFISCDLVDLFDCDLLCLHAELHSDAPYPSLNLINADFLAQLKEKAILLNASRGGIVNEQALIESTRSFVYCTDVYLNEPSINEQIIDRATLCTPHIAGHSIEAKYAAVSMVSERLQALAHSNSAPIRQLASSNKIAGLGQKQWQQAILEIYNPIEESAQLKKAADKTACFLNLRHKHHNRHDFSFYF